MHKYVIPAGKKNAGFPLAELSVRNYLKGMKATELYKNTQAKGRGAALGHARFHDFH